MNKLEQFLRDLNQAWLDQRYDELSDFFAEGIVMLPPGTSEPIVGVESLLESYRQFTAAATIHDFRIDEISLYEYQSMAMAHVKFDIEYEIDGSRHREAGLDICAINTAGEKPRVVWRTQVMLDNALSSLGSS